MIFIGQLLCSTVGFVALSFALLSYESEEEKVRNWLNDIWEAANTANASVGERLLKAVRTIGQSAEWVLTRLYGPDIISLRAAVTSVSLCTGVGLVAVFFLFDIIDAEYFIFLSPGVMLLAAQFVANRPLSYIVSFIGIALWNYTAIMISFSFPAEGLGLGTVWVSSILDFAVIALTRALVRSVSRAATLRVAIGYIAFSVVLALILVVVPYLLTDVINARLDSRYTIRPEFTIEMWIFNFFAFLTCLSLILLALLSVFYRAIWFVIPRTVHIPVKFGQRRVLGSLGTVLVLAPWSSVGTAVEKLVDAVGSLF